MPLFVVALASAIGLAAQGVAACALDQRPSLSVDGHLVGVNTRPPATRQELATWSYFVVPGTVPIRRSLLLAEDRREVAHTLTADAMRQPCAWAFGDGGVAYGWQVRHTYAHAGRWRIGVYVWDPAGGRWDLIDQATITTR